MTAGLGRVKSSVRAFLRAAAPVLGGLTLALAGLEGRGAETPSTQGPWRYECPGQITLTEQASGFSQPWVAETGSPARTFAALALYLGPPRDSARQAPDQEKRLEKQRVELSWVLNPAESADPGYWLECRYDSTKVTLEVRVSSAARQCRTEQSIDSQGNRTDSGVVVCRK